MKKQYVITIATRTAELCSQNPAVMSPGRQGRGGIPPSAYRRTLVAGPELWFFSRILHGTFVWSLGSHVQTKLFCVRTG